MRDAGQRAERGPAGLAVALAFSGSALYGAGAIRRAQFYAPSLFGVALGALNGEVQQLARGRVDPGQPTANGRSRTVRRQARYSRVEINVLDGSLLAQSGVA